MGMTIERAIDVIDHRYAIMDYVENEALSAALEIAITNMQMVEKIKRIYNSWRTGDYKDSTECMLEEVIEAIEEFPSATSQEPTTKNDLGVDCVARKDVERYIEGFINEYTPREELEFINLELDGLKHIPSVTPQEPQTFKWCTDCKEYDQEKHCCHRWSKVIRDTVEEMKQESKIGHWINKQYLFESCSAECSSCHKRSNGIVHDNGFSLECKYFNFCPNCGAKMVEQQESEG